MANNYVFPGGVSTYVPSLSADLVVEFSRNPNKFPIAQYIDYRIVDKQKGYYVRMQNNTQAMVIDSTDNLWADGADSPKIIDGNDEFTFPQFTCVRRRLPKMLGQLAVDQGGWDILDQSARLLAMQVITARCLRIHSTLTTSANWGSNYATATTAGGGTWATASSTAPYIRKSLAYAQIAIEQATLGTVSAGDLYLVMNPNTAKIVATGGEFLDFVKQNPTSIGIWENSPQFRLYGIPDNLMGLRVIVDNTVYTSSVPGTAATLNFTFPDGYACLLSKQKAVNSQAGASFSTYSAFLYEDLITEVFNDVENRRYKVFVTENIDDSAQALVAPQSGYLLNIAA